MDYRIDPSKHVPCVGCGFPHDGGTSCAVAHQLRAALAPGATGYECLSGVLDRAFHQAARGKGAERHADNRPFDDQPMQHIARRRGIGFILGQADKKSEEAQGMLGRGEKAEAVRELLGAIVYLAGAIIYIESEHYK